MAGRHFLYWEHDVVMIVFEQEHLHVMGSTFPLSELILDQWGRGCSEHSEDNLPIVEEDTVRVDLGLRHVSLVATFKA